MSAWGGYGLALVCLCVFDGLGGRKTRNLSPGVQCYNLSSTLRALLCLRGSRDRRAGPVASLSGEAGGERGGWGREGGGAGVSPCRDDNTDKSQHCCQSPRGRRAPRTSGKRDVDATRSSPSPLVSDEELLCPQWDPPPKQKTKPEQSRSSLIGGGTTRVRATTVSRSPGSYLDRSVSRGKRFGSHVAVCFENTPQGIQAVGPVS